MEEVDIKAAIEVFKAISDLTRFRMVAFLVSKNLVSCKELSAKFNLSQPTLSHHFSKLEKAKVVTSQKQGTEKFYILNKNFIKNCGINYSLLEKMN